MKKLLCLLLAVAMLLSMAACGGGNAEPEVEVASAEAASSAAETADAASGLVGVRSAEDYDAVSAELYEAALGEFYAAYQTASACTENNERYALMALAEAKLLESGVMVPNTSQGGGAVISRIGANTVSGVKWGGDADRYETLLVAEELVTAEDYAAMRELYGELQGTGEYYEAAKAYMEEHGYTLKDTFNMAYTDDPQSWDVFAEWNATLYEPLCNTFDNLMMYDCENVLQPALAESYEVSDDGLTYTFHLREGVMWVDSQGREIAELTAQDFVSAAQHLFDMGSGIEDLWTVDGCGIVGATEYYSGELADFSQVGVKAVDDYTLEYTLEAECPYFLSMLTYTTFSPLCTSYYESLGGGFGADYNEDCTYGTDPDHIAYCGPYLITSATAENSIYFKANEKYWNADNVTIKELTWLYNDGSDPTKSYNDCLSGVTDSCGLTTSIIEIAKEDGNYDKYAHVSATDATAYLTYLNLNRGTFANFNDGTALASTKTQEQVDAAYAAVNNQHFRLAMAYGFDRLTYNEQVRGAELAPNNLINSYTTGDFVQLDADTTVDVNGTATTFPAGTYYGEIVQAQLDADGYPIMAWNPDANDGLGGSTGYDGYYNPEAAAAEMELAIADLAEQGYEVSAENPIVLDYPVWDGAEVYINRANVYKQSVEAATNNCVVVNIVTCSDVNEWYYAEYYCYSGAEMNFDIGDMTGWSPDYGDPCSMLATFLPDYAGYCTMSLGIY